MKQEFEIEHVSYGEPLVETLFSEIDEILERDKIIEHHKVFGLTIHSERR